MFVSRSMTRKVITVDQEAGIRDAQELMSENNIRHLPIVDKNQQLIGIVTDRDIRSALPYRFFDAPQNEKEKFGKLKVKDIMTGDPISISPTSTIQDALLLIQKSKVGALPVVDDDRRLKGGPCTRESQLSRNTGVPTALLIRAEGALITGIGR